MAITGQFGTITLNGTQSSTLRAVRTEDNGKTANLFVTPIPASDSNESLILDLFGMSRTINITGSVAGTKANLGTFITSMEALMGGNQTGKTFISSIHPTNKTCYINSFRYTYTEGNENLLNYTLELIEGS